MPWKLLAFIVIMSLVLVFIGFNLDNRCDISVVFATFQSVPVVITILASFLSGLLAALVLSVAGRGGKRKAAAKGAAQAQAGASSAGGAQPSAARPAGSGSARRRKSRPEATGPYKPGADQAE